MCGFVGEIRKARNQPQKIGVIEKLNELIIHRGPDSFGSAQLGQSTFAHRRLSILDLSNNASQPMFDDANELLLVFNGEIYNYQEVRKELLSLGHEFNGSGDTEVLLKSYLQWGEKCVYRLNGMFSFGIYDAKKKLFFAFRDPIGQKPFFYSVIDAGLVFSSELRPLLEHPDISNKLENSSIAHYLIYESFPHSTTPIKNIHKLNPGSQLIYSVEEHKIEIKKYWKNIPDESLSKELAKLSDEKLISLASSILDKSVVQHLRSDVPLGIYLSGGIDSNVLLDVSAKHLNASSIQTFTVGSDNKSYDESSISRKTSVNVGTVHHEIYPTSEEKRSSVIKLLNTLDEPISDLGLLASFEVAKFASSKVKVVFAGDGGDELFFGYEPFNKWKIGEVIASLPKFVRENIILAVIDRLPSDFEYMSFKTKAKIFFKGLMHPQFSRNAAWYSGFDLSSASDILESDYKQHILRKNADKVSIVYEFLYQLHRDMADHDDLTRLAIEYQNTYLPNLICSHTDKASMAFSIEARSPFLDKDVISFANALPVNAKLRNGKGKWILRQYLAQNPNFVHIFNRKKQGYTVPLGLWFNNELYDFVEHYLNSDQISKAKIFKKNEVQRLWGHHKSGYQNNTKKLWPIVVLNHWIEKNRVTI